MYLYIQVSIPFNHLTNLKHHHFLCCQIIHEKSWMNLSRMIIYCIHTVIKKQKGIKYLYTQVIFLIVIFE